MSKKTLILALIASILAPSVGLAADADIQSEKSPFGLFCTPTTQSVASGQWVTLSAGYYNSPPINPQPLTWSAAGGNPSTGVGSSFSTQFFINSPVETRTVSVTDGYSSAFCTIYVYANQYTPTPTPNYGWLSLDHTVRNLTRGGEGAWVSAMNGDRLQYISRITVGSVAVTDAEIEADLPNSIRYLSGTTTVNGDSKSNGIAGSGLSLGTLRANRSYTVRFEAVVDTTQSNSTFTSTVSVAGDNVASQSRTSSVWVGNFSTPTPTPTYIPPYGGNGQLTLSLVGRNITRGQTGEHASVGARGGDTIEFILRVRSQSGGSLRNVVVTDYLPSGLEYVRNSTSLNGTITVDGIVFNGLNIGWLSPSQEATVKFSARVLPDSVPSWGQVSVTDTAQARADGTGTVSAQMKINLGQNLSLANASGVQTGPIDSIILAISLAALVTAGYAVYTRTNRFGRRMAFAEVQRLSRSAGPNFVK